MVRLTVDLIARGTSGYTKKKRDEDMETYLSRLTHLYLEDKCIDDVGEDLALCRNLSVLYLYENRVTDIPNLSKNFCLTHVYLQHNQISVMANLTPLRKLTKLYLGGNMITVIEGLEKLDCLEELHVENQQLPPGEKLLFDPRSLNAISRSLQVFNVSGNNLDSIREFAVITNLTQFMVAENKLTDLKEIALLLNQWNKLWRLDLYDNPLCQKAKYRDRLIVMSNSLGMLDGKEISQTSRQFLQNWKASKDAQRKKKEENDRVGGMGDSTAAYVPTMNHLNKISSYVMPGLPKRQFEEVLARSTVNASGSVPSSAPTNKSHSQQQQFVTSPTSFGHLQRSIMDQHANRQLTRSKSHIPRLPSTINM